MVVSFSSLIVNIQLTHEGWGLPRGLGCKVESHQRAEDCVAVLALGQATLSLARRERWPLTARQGATELWTTDGYGASESHMMLVPSELRARRRALGLTQVQLAAVLGVAGNTVARWEPGERPVGTPSVVRLALGRLEAGGGADWREPRQARAGIASTPAQSVAVLSAGTPELHGVQLPPRLAGSANPLIESSGESHIGVSDCYLAPPAC